jgi:hypothetical protein
MFEHICSKDDVMKEMDQEETALGFVLPKHGPVHHITRLAAAAGP